MIGEATGDLGKRFASMVMDMSQRKVRRYWNGFGWVDNPVEAFQCVSHPDGMCGTYLSLVEAGCQAALVVVEYSRIDEVVTVHGIRLMESTTWRA